MGELTPLAKELIDGKNIAFLATIMPDGSPQVTPVWIDREGETILVNTAEGRVKHRNVARDPRVALAITDNQNPYRMVAIKGEVTEITTEGADEHIDKLAKKYLGLEKYPWRAGEKRIILRIKPLRVAEMR